MSFRRIRNPTAADEQSATTLLFSIPGCSEMKPVVAFFRNFGFNRFERRQIIHALCWLIGVLYNKPTFVTDISLRIKEREDLQMRVVLLIAVASVSTVSLATAEDRPLTYERDIRPIFRAHCFDCHGATDELKGGLDLRLVRFLQKGGETGPAILAGQPNESFLLERIRNGEMPPGEDTVPAGEIAIIEKWIAAGAKTARPEPDSIGPGLGITEEERSFWSFQPIRHPDVADLASFPKASRVRTPIDALLLNSAMTNHAGSESNKAASTQQSFAVDADRRTLIIRAYFDLIGLPPSPDEIDKWLNDAQDDWYDRLLTELLASPHYGERWGRHWLDVAGYADSEGYSTADAARQWAWKYRDWVIRSLNQDMPFDQFVAEQLAGDELAGPINGDLTPQQIDLFSATGFLRMAADGTGSGANNPDGRNQVIADTLKIVGTSMLGLSLQCAQCHDHRYDPIPHTDYFAIRAVFEPALDWKSWKVPNARRISLYTAADRKKAAEIEAEAAKIAAEKTVKQTEYMKQALDQELMKYKEPLGAKLREAYETAGNKRSDEQKKLLTKNPSVNISTGTLYQYLPKAAEELKKFDARIAETRAKKPVEEFVRALIEPPNHAPETKLFHRGDHQQPKQTVTPASLSVASLAGQPVQFPLNDDKFPTTGRRLAFAQWLASRDNPLFARVIVNRAWMHHFGKGLVSTPADFGKLGTKPSHPEVLDWLADELISSGWSLKSLHRTILSSTAWRQSKEPSKNPSAFLVPLQRLEAETLRDRMLAASGQLDRTLLGRPVKIKEDDTGQVVVDGAQTRRSLYIQVRRSRPVAMLQTFDAPVMETNCESRPSSTVATQSLMLLNGQFILDQAAKLADRAAKEAQAPTDEQRSLIQKIPTPTVDEWQYGYGSYDEAENRTASFTTLPHFTGSQWQAGKKLPDTKLGYVLLHATGGHPDIAERAVIRRWTAPAGGEISIKGDLTHGSPNGDGVRGRVVSSRSGKAGEWTAFNAPTGTVAVLKVQSGDTVDFITDCRTGHTSDSFNWHVNITLKTVGGVARKADSKDAFHGPAKPNEPIELLPGQLVRAWQLALCREPTQDELSIGIDFLARQMETLHRNSAMIPKGRSASRQAMTSLCQALLSSNEFLYVE
jgi:mono/diheme cytochrome c family protein